VFCGGELLPVALAEQFFSCLRAELYHQYGPTEACVDATVWRCRPGEQRTTIPIGRPIANTQIYIVDGQLQPVPIGVPGELCIGGAGLARGYLNRADHTAERFIASPFHDAESRRLYRTGDVARYRLDGTIEFLGRLDLQVKLRGFRIELGEVEAILTQHPAVRDVVAIVRDDGPGDRRLVAYLTCQRGSTASAPDLHDFVKKRLPDYMVPSAFVILDALPLTTTGKVDRRALPAPSRTREDDAQAIVLPRTSLEEAIAAIWQGVLGLDRIGIHDNFFDLGGHSLLATRVMARVRAALRVDLSLKAFFETPTVAHLSRLVSDQRSAHRSPDDLANLLDVVEGLPEDRARALLLEVSDAQGTGAPESTR
jgi:acyl carrier protein